MSRSHLPGRAQFSVALGTHRPPSFFTRIRSALLTLACIGCVGADGAVGPDGADGGTAVSVTWLYAPQSFTLSDTRIPLLVTRDAYYWTYPGTYSVAYIAWDGSFWTGTYSVTYDPGEPGQPGAKGKAFWQRGRDGVPGADGLDLYYRIGLYSTGPTISFVGAFLFDDAVMKEQAAYANARTDSSTIPTLWPIDTTLVRATTRKGPWTIHSEFHRGDPAAAKWSVTNRR